MRKLLLLSVLVIGMAFTSVTEPPFNFNGVYYGQQNSRVVNLGWNSPYVGAAYTIKRNGAVIRTGTNQPYNVVSINVEPNYKSSTFSISQTVNGETSQEVFTTVRK
jgi:hypothetical protein